jgi:hypothetical protein
MNDRASAFKRRLDIFGQMSEVGREDRGCQFDQNSFLSKSGRPVRNSSKKTVGIHGFAHFFKHAAVLVQIALRQVV